MPADKGVRLDDRQRIANFREQPIDTNEYHSVDGAEGEFLWSSSPQNVDLLPQRPYLCLKHYPRPDQIDNHPTNEPAKIPHCARSSSDSRSTAKQDKVCDRDRQVKTETRPDSNTHREFYVVRIRMDQDDILRRMPEFIPTPGMPADVYIKTGERTFFEYIMKPVFDSFSRAFRET
jgi:hypothetical protein